jgi:hypothetical protein
VLTVVVAAALGRGQRRKGLIVASRDDFIDLTLVSPGLLVVEIVHLEVLRIPQVLFTVHVSAISPSHSVPALSVSTELAKRHDAAPLSAEQRRLPRHTGHSGRLWSAAGANQIAALPLLNELS